MKNIYFEMHKVDKVNVELKFYVNGSNILEFVQNGNKHSSTWNFESLITWFNLNLKNIMLEDPFPYEVEGNTASELDNNSADALADNASNEEILEFHNRIHEWREKHSWLNAADGAILPDVFFRRVGSKIEISWWTSDMYDGVEFFDDENCFYCELKEFEEAIKNFVREYQKLY